MVPIDMSSSEEGFASDLLFDFDFVGPRISPMKPTRTSVEAVNEQTPRKLRNRDEDRVVIGSELEPSVKFPSSSFPGLRGANWDVKTRELKTNGSTTRIDVEAVEAVEVVEEEPLTSD